MPGGRRRRKKRQRPPQRGMGDEARCTRRVGDGGGMGASRGARGRG
jgi:hypothetical protein